MLLQASSFFLLKNPIDFSPVVFVVYVFYSQIPEFLLKFGTGLRPLRVYGQQVETLDYPYPDCSLQFCQRAFFQEKAQAQLR